MATKAAKKNNPGKTTSEILNSIGIDSICLYVASGESLRSWAIGQGIPPQSVIDWINADQDRSVQYAHARDDRADAVFESLDDVSDQAVRAESAVEVAGLRLKADNIKWKLARMNAKKYGDKVAIGGADDLPSIKSEVALPPAEAYAALLAAGRSGK